MKASSFVTLILSALVIAIALLGIKMEPWLYMWALALGIFSFFKWVTLAHHPTLNSGVRYPAVYLLGWVGMDPAPFKSRNREIRADIFLLVSGVINLLFGLLLIKSVELISSRLWILQGWVFCIGIMLILHFGIFKILTWGLRNFGFDVEPIMKLPLATKTVSEFWGGRWNRAFKELVFPFVFRPLKRRIGPINGIVATFLLSGILHEIVISLPARAGWGLPTLYFLIQPLGMLLERNRIIGSLSNFGQRLFTYVIVTGPAFILFHPPFMQFVILPFAKFLGVKI